MTDEPRLHLPLDDRSVDALPESTRLLVGEQWERRATAELRVGSMFSVIARELFEAGADAIVIQICARAVSDEVRHAEICRLLAERYLARTVAWPPPGPVPMPLHESAPEALRPTLHLVAMSCINETIATAWLEACLRDATVPLARAAIRELAADDVYHARMGWAHLASSYTTPKMRAEVAAWLVRLLEVVVLPWLRDGRRYGEGVPSHGVASAATTCEVITRTVHDVILPGFAALGIDTTPATDWAVVEVPVRRTSE